MADPKTSKNAGMRPSDGGGAGAFDRNRVPLYRGPSNEDDAAAMSQRFDSAPAKVRRGAIQKAPARLLDAPGTNAESSRGLVVGSASQRRETRGLIERPSVEVLEERIRDSIPHVDDYDVELGGPNGLTYVKRAPLVVRGQRISIEEVFPSAAARAALGCDAVSRSEAREAFLTRFADVLRARPEAPPRDEIGAIALQDLLGGSANVRLYTRAIAEENDSAAFRAAVVLSSVRAFREEIELLDWTLPKHLIIGGPSGAGKTFATKTILRALMRYAHVAPELERSLYVTEQDGSRSSGAHGRPQPVPFIVGVDGGDARATSQIRKLVLQAALVLGYVGISDLHAKTKALDIKDAIKAAAFHPSSRVHVVEPRTFANVLDESYGRVARERVRSRGIFCLVDTPADVIRFQGEGRAWYRKGPKDAETFSLNNADVGCESKAYNAEHLETGRHMSRNAHVEYVTSAVDNGRVPISVLYDNIAKLAGGSVDYGPPNIEIHYGPFHSRRGFLRKKGEFAELPAEVRARLEAAGKAPRPPASAGTGPAVAHDPTAVVHVPRQQVIVAHGFQANVDVASSASTEAIRPVAPADEFLVIESAITTIEIPPLQETVHTENHKAWEDAKRAGKVDADLANLVHVPVEATGYSLLTAVATHLGKSTRALIEDLDAAARRRGAYALLCWCRELRSAAGLRRGVKRIDPLEIEDVLVEAGLALEIMDLGTRAPDVVVVRIPQRRRPLSVEVRVLLRENQFDLLLPKEAAASLDLADGGRVYVSKGFRNTEELGRDPFTMAPPARPGR